MARIANEAPSAGTRDAAVSTAVVEAVSSDTDTPVHELPSLNDVVDPDALDDLFAGRESNGRVEFGYAGRVVTVRADGTVELSIPSGTP